MEKKTSKFLVTFAEHLDTLDLYTTAITRAHGKSHPEAFEVRKLFETIHGKVKNRDSEPLNLAESFKQLRQVTNNYTVPADVCGTYAEVYRMLAELDEAY